MKITAKKRNSNIKHNVFGEKINIGEDFTVLNEQKISIPKKRETGNKPSEHCYCHSCGIYFQDLREAVKNKSRFKPSKATMGWSKSGLTKIARLVVRQR